MSSTVSWSLQHVFRHQTAEMEKKKKPPALQMLCEHWAKACHICKGKSIIHTQKHTSGPFDRSITDHWPTVNAFIHTLLSWHWIDGKGANWPTGQATLQPAIHTLHWEATQPTTRLCQHKDIQSLKLSDFSLMFLSEHAYMYINFIIKHNIASDNIQYTIHLLEFVHKNK